MLTTIQCLKERLGIATEDVRDDAILNGMLAMVSARFENQCNRKFGYAQNTTEEFQGADSELRVSRYPIDESQPITFQFMERAADGWQTATAPSVDYLVRGGCIISLLTSIASQRGRVRVTFSGGYVLPDGSTPALPAGSTAGPLPDDLEQAAIEQIVWLYQNKDRTGLVSIAAEGGRIQQFTGLDLLPTVTATLAKYERWMN
jgi:hypothetical protein